MQQQQISDLSIFLSSLICILLDDSVGRIEPFKTFMWPNLSAYHWLFNETLAVFTCKHELRNIWFDMQAREERKRTLGLVYFLLDAA